MYDKSYVMITDRKLIGKNVLKDDEIVFASCVPGEKVDLLPSILYSSIVDIPHLTSCRNQEILDAISSKSRVAVVSMAAAGMIGADADGDLVYLMPRED